MCCTCLTFCQTPSQCEGDVAKRQRETAAVSGWHAVRRDGGRETQKSLPQSNAVHLTALPSRGTRFCLRLGAPYKIDRFAHKCSLFPPPAAVTFVARRGRKRREQNSPNSGTLRREQAPALLYYNRHFLYQGNHPALP